MSIFKLGNYFLHSTLKPFHKVVLNISPDLIFPIVKLAHFRSVNAWWFDVLLNSARAWATVEAKHFFNVYD